MYSRGLGGDGKERSIPEKYDGTALLDPIAVSESAPCASAPKFIDSQKKEIKFSPPESSPEEPECQEQPTDGANGEDVPSFAPLKWVRGLLPEKSSLFGVLPKIELEELIIIGLALFLFFSKTGDKECALILLSLIFIH